MSKVKIWKIWIGDSPIPEHFKQYTDTWDKIKGAEVVDINNDTLVQYFERNVIDEITEKFNGNNQVINHWFRYMFMYYKGGIYLDLDVEVLKDSDIWYSEQPTFFCETKDWYNNHVMICKSKYDPLYFSLANKTLHYDMNDTKVEINTGPALVTRVLKETTHHFNLYDPEYTTPWNWNEKPDRSRITENTIAVHHFCHSWKK
jgi:mannosyltransferase OCH1-like enzyme